MADGRERSNWNRSAALMSLIANCNRDPKRQPRPFKADDFNPFAQRNRVEKLSKEDIRANRDVLKKAFGVKPNPKKRKIPHGK